MTLHTFSSTWRFPALQAVLLGVILISAGFWGDHHFLSPDETVNAVVAEQFRLTSELNAVEPLNSVAGGIVHPRSAIVRDDRIIPVSFPFYPALLGSIGKVAGSMGMTMLPVVLFCLSLGAVWLVSRDLFGTSAAMMTTTLYGLSPVVLLYAWRGYWHNGPMVWLLVIGVALWLRLSERFRSAGFLLGATTFSLAIAIRPSEAAWVLVLMGILYGVVRPVRAWIAVVGLGIVLAIGAATLGVQRVTIGNPWSVGYASVLSSQEMADTTAAQVLNVARYLFFPFGIEVSVALRSAAEFFLRFGAPIVFLGALGVGSALFSRDRRSIRTIALGTATLIVTLWLILAYGSFQFTESFDGNTSVLGSSYLRYWLPAFALLSIFVGRGVAVLARYGPTRLLQGLVIGAMVFVSVSPAFADPLYGMIKATQSDLRIGQAQRAVALPIIPEQAVVYAGPADKVFFPERAVIGYNRLSERETSQLASFVAASRPVFFVTGNRDELTVAQRAAREIDHTFVRRLRLPGGDGLYELTEGFP